MTDGASGLKECDRMMNYFHGMVALIGPWRSNYCDIHLDSGCPPFSCRSGEALHIQKFVSATMQEISDDKLP